MCWGGVGRCWVKSRPSPCAGLSGGGPGLHLLCLVLPGCLRFPGAPLPMPPPLGTGPGHQAGSGLVPPQWRAGHKGGGREPHDPACPLVAGAPAEAEGCLGCGSLLPSPLCAPHPGPCPRVLEACHAACLGQGHPPLTPPPTQCGTQSLCLEHVLVSSSWEGSLRAAPWAPSLPWAVCEVASSPTAGAGAAAPAG